MNEQRPSQPLESRFRSEFTTDREQDAFKDVLDRNPWADGLLTALGRVLPGDLAGSMRVANITAATLISLDEQGNRPPLKQSERDAIILGGALQDIGKGFEIPDIRDSVYASDARWRDDPYAWQWDIVRRHPRKSYDLVLAAVGDFYEGTGHHVAQIVSLHHALKRENSYPEREIVKFDTFDDFILLGLEVVAAADVADAVSRNDKGQGRSYLQDEEFAERSLQDTIQKEVAVSDTITQLVVEHALRFKGKG